jgi:AcrR family transcriptional regulator
VPTKNTGYPAGSAQSDTRAGILAAALEAYSKYGFRGATTRRIAELAGVNEVTLFRHFGSKEVLIGEALRSFPGTGLHVRLPVHPCDPETELAAWSEGQLAHLRDKRWMIRTYMGEIGERSALWEDAAGSLRAAITDLHEYLVRVREAGMSCGGFDDRDAAKTLISALFSDAIGRDMLPEAYPPAQTAAHQYAMTALLLIGVDSNRPPAQSDATGAPRG